MLTQSPNCRRARKVSQCSARLLSGGAFFCTATTCAAIAGRQARAFRRAVLQELAGHPARVRRTALAHALDVCKTENPTRDTTHGGACLTGSLPVYRKRPFTTPADRRRPRLDGGRQSCIDEPARGTYVSPRSRARPSVPANSGSAALMNPHTKSLVSVPTAVNSGLRRLNQFQKNRMPTKRNP